MPGAGSSGAGIGPAGANPVPNPTALPTIATSVARRYDPFNKVYPFNDVGQLIADSPIWQAVALAMGIVRGSLRSTPKFGIELDALRNATDATAQKAAEDAAARALADLVAAGDVVIVTVTAELPWNGRFFTDVRNLREPGSKPLTFTTNTR